ncbi:hypothetical protein I7I53_06446 [Histoplasma capsulatum var. duboisii H88]|uniref:Uncharacterized protein n=1 Tax=Ajellomyces capsulatus (strain H88) TaxID=544711 RepID=A0A8A1LGT4_AJEC8|nr:hypothetical protein I7I53_06446 [Histoplasma capsulatum var. duboisii H88]
MKRWQMGAGQRHQVRLADGRSKETAFTGISGDCGFSISPRVEAASTLSKTMFILNASKTVWNVRRHILSCFLKRRVKLRRF